VTDLNLRVRDAIVVLAWLPVLLALLGLGVAVAGLGIRTALMGDLPPLGSAALLESELALAGVLAAVAYFYLVLANETFGTDTVEIATRQAKDITDAATDRNTDDEDEHEHEDEAPPGGGEA
jgi:hypothetical protein